jgi:excisionase family DNA binding protein
MHVNAIQAPELMTVKELAAEWRQHPATIYRKIGAGEVPAVRLGDGHGALRIRRSEVEALLAGPAERGEGSGSPALTGYREQA